MTTGTLTTSQAANLLGVTPTYVRRLVREGRLAVAEATMSGYLLDAESVRRFQEERHQDFKVRFTKNAHLRNALMHDTSTLQELAEEIAALRQDVGELKKLLSELAADR